MKSLSGALDSFVVDEFSVWVNERKDFFTSQKCQPPPKKNFLEETTHPFVSLVSSHLFFRFCCVILVYTPVYI